MRYNHLVTLEQAGSTGCPVSEKTDRVAGLRGETAGHVWNAARWSILSPCRLMETLHIRLGQLNNLC